MARVNPSLSATYKTAPLLRGFFVSDYDKRVRTLECRIAALGSITGQDSPGRRRRRRRPQGEGPGWPESIPLPLSPPHSLVSDGGLRRRFRLINEFSQLYTFKPLKSEQISLSIS